MKLKNKNRNFNKIKVIFIIISFLTLVFFIIFNKVTKSVSYYFINFAENETIKLVSNVINDGTTSDTYKNLKYDNLYSITKNKDDEVSMIDYNSIIVNDFLNDITSNIQNSLLLLEKDNLFYIPFGFVFNNPLFNTIGPNIPVKLKLISSVLTNINTNIKEYGINNCLIEMSIFIEVRVKIMLPIISKDITITNEVPVSYKILKGSIPNYYGLNDTNKNSSIYSIPLE